VDSASQVRSLVPPCERASFDGIVDQSILGASTHIKLIGNMIEAIARDGAEANRPSAEIVKDIHAVCDFFIETRGSASRAVRNAIQLMIHGIDSCAYLAPEAACERIIATKDEYAATAAEATESCVTYAATLASNMGKIFVYDYSSTVDRLLQRLAELGHCCTVVIPESRVIDGGKPFVKTCLEVGHAIRFIPEAAMLESLVGCDAAFMGAETFYPDGTGFNTLGSDIVGVLCSHLDVPLYFITPMIKLDTRPVYGQSKRLVYDDLADKLTATWGSELDISGIDFVVPELVGVPAQHICAFITERGIIPACQMFGPAMHFAAYLEGSEKTDVPASPTPIQKRGRETCHGQPHD
jgi:ribose 1,5-bisphosphate isomerase